MSAGGNFRNAVTDSAITEILKEFQTIKTDRLNILIKEINESR